MDVELCPGDILYLPRGFPHSAATGGSPSVHVTLSIYGIAWSEVFGSLIRNWTVDEIAFRKWIPSENMRIGKEFQTRLALHLRTLAERIDALNGEEVAAWLKSNFFATSTAAAPSLRRLFQE
jgi:hypothetical protein